MERFVSFTKAFVFLSKLIAFQNLGAGASELFENVRNIVGAMPQAN